MGSYAQLAGRERALNANNGGVSTYKRARSPKRT